MNLRKKPFGSDDHCSYNVDLRYRLYQKRYPRFTEIASLPIMRLRFLHWGVHIAEGSQNWCFIDHLFLLVFENGQMRCNLNIHRADVVPELRAHIDKIIELVELRHYPMVSKIGGSVRSSV